MKPEHGAKHSAPFIKPFNKPRKTHQHEYPAEQVSHEPFIICNINIKINVGINALFNSGACLGQREPS
jgi:hypothetical protein